MGKFITDQILGMKWLNGVMTTPALVVDGQVVSYGKVLKKDEVISILKKVRA